MLECQISGGLDELLNQPIDKQCICDLSEDMPLRPRYIVPDYANFTEREAGFCGWMRQRTFTKAINSLLIFYKHVPEV